MTVIHRQHFVVLIVLLILIMVDATHGNSTTKTTSSVMDHATHRNLKPNITSSHEECGISKALSERVVGGMESPLQAWPWMVAITITKGQKVVNLTSVHCGGALITHSHVLTAAHCVYGHPPQHLALRLGEHDILSDSDSATPVDFGASAICIHERHKPTSGFDIAIIKMKSDVKFSDSIRPICLPTKDMSIKTFEHMMPYIAGWGRLSYRGAIASTIRHVQLEVISNEVCGIAYAGITKIRPNQLCTGGSSGGKDACQGDSGGPLVIPINNKFVAIGVVSVGIKCADQRFPGIFTRVSSFIDWIDRVIKNV